MNTVSKIVYDKLASGGGIFLPDVGSLYVERDPARFISKKEIKPPHKRVVYSRKHNPALESVVDLLARTESVEAGMAPQYYADWLAGAGGGSGFVEINGVGVIKNNFFYPSVGLYERLNPLGGKNIQLKRSGNNSRKLLIAGIAVLALAAVLLAVLSLDRSYHRENRAESIGNLIQDNDSYWGRDSSGAEDYEAYDDPEEDTEGISETAGAEGTTAITVKDNGSRSAVPAYHVVAGVFDTKRNAEKCVREDPLRIGSNNYKIYPYKSDRYMVSAFETTDKAAADARRRELRKYKSDIWVYTKK